MTNQTPCHNNCFWYCNDAIYNDELCSCSYYKINIFTTPSKYISRKFMLEPSTCDKYINWDDVEKMMRNCVDDMEKLNHKV
jgi:hypothetical protein